MKPLNVKLLGRESVRALLQAQTRYCPRGSGNRARRRMGEDVGFQHIGKWTRPRNYMGEDWPEYYAFLGRNRDSDILTESNFASGLALLGGEQTAEDGTPLVAVVREGHFLCGWVEWIAIHESRMDLVAKADKMLGRLEDYPVLDEDDFSERESEEADRVWRDCYDEKERLDYIRRHPSQFDFDSLADLFAVVRGKWFNGYASELLH